MPKLRTFITSIIWTAFFCRYPNRKNLGEPIFGVPKYSRSGRKLRQRERAMILASKFAIFKNKKEAVPLQLKEMPEKLLNPDMREIEDRLPQEINMMYKTVKPGIENVVPTFVGLAQIVEENIGLA